MPDAISSEHRDERDVREARHGDDEAGDARRRRAGSRQSTSSPIRPPIQIEPAREVQPVEERARAPRGDVCAAWPGDARETSSAAAAARARRSSASSSATDRCSPLRPVDPDRERGRGDEEREAELEVDVAAAERRRADQRHERADVEGRAKRELAPSRAAR